MPKPAQKRLFDEAKKRRQLGLFLRKSPYILAFSAKLDLFRVSLTSLVKDALEEMKDSPLLPENQSFDKLKPSLVERNINEIDG